MLRRNFTPIVCGVVASVLIAASGAYSARDYYVDKTNGHDANGGRSWEDAFATIQEGIDACDTGSENDPDTVHVAAETYYENVILDSYIVLLGGYPPGGGERDWEANETIIDGDDAGSAVSLDESGRVKIDGFKITNGNSEWGGGVKCGNSNLDVLNCTICNNEAFKSGTDTVVVYGGGLFCKGSTVVLVNCTVSNNTAEASTRSASGHEDGNGHAYGGGIYLDECRATFIECAINDNEAYAKSDSWVSYSDNAYAKGGGVYSLNSSPALIHSMVVSNTAYARAYGQGTYGQSHEPGAQYTPFCGVGNRYASAVGGGIWCQNALDRSIPPSLRNCLVAQNTLEISICRTYSKAYEAAGGIFFDAAYSYYPSPVVTSCTVADNTKHGIYASGYSKPTLTDCILWRNGDDVYGVSCSDITYCDIEDGDCGSGEGNISDDPLFVVGYHLSQTAAGQDSNSQCVDAGSDYAASQGLASRSTRTDQKPDLYIVDLGWHYPSDDSNHNPTLSNGRVEPTCGREDTTFSFLVDYRDKDGDAPSVMMAYIDDDSGHDMALESGYAHDGTYVYHTNLAKGEHKFHFYCEDGNDGSCREPASGAHKGPSVDGDTSLSNGRIEPDSGTTRTTFTYSVDYYDAHGYAPSVKKVYIDYDSGHDMALASGNAANGTYTFETTLSSGEHTFYFYFDNGHGDNDKDPTVGVYHGPLVNDPPVLSDGQVDPEAGTICREYTYEVHYYDPEGSSPSVAQVVIDGEDKHEMSLYSGDPADGIYVYRTRLEDADHTYYFYFEDDQSDGDRAPDHGAYDGPTVTSAQCEYYVDATYGDDESNEGLSWDDAFASMQRGIDTCQTGNEASA